MKKSDGNTVEDIVAFWGLDKKIVSTNFKGGRNITLFGGSVLDLSEIKLSKDGAILELYAMFGGIEVRTPKDYKVKVDSTGILGGVDNTINEEGRKEPTLTLKCTAILGGIEVK